MSRLGSRDLRALLAILRHVYAIQNSDRFPRAVLRQLPRLVGCDRASYTEVTGTRRRVRALVEPSDAAKFPGDEEILARHIDQHPLYRYFQREPTGRAVRFSDFLSPSRLHRLALYQEFFRRQGIESQLAFRTSSGPAYFAGIALSRGPGRPDFTERDRLCLDLLRPHLVQAYRTARALSQSRQELEGLRRAAAMVGVGAIRLGRSGRVTIVAEPVRTWLAEYFGHRSTERRPLPDDLRRWLRQEEATLTGSGDVPASRRPIVIEGDGRRLIVRLATDPAGSVLVFEERRAALAAEPLRRFGLSHRQTEVLRWVAQGKTNPEIASILGTSPRTVGKHLEHVYAKLGVETRTAAAAMALTAHTDPDPSS